MAKQFKYIDKIQRPDGTYRYVYKDGEDTQPQTSAVSKGREMADWAKQWFNRTNVSSLSSSKEVATGKSKLTKRKSSVYRAAVRQTGSTKEGYKNKAEEISKKAATEKESNEKYYKDLYESELNAYRDRLNSKYPGNSTKVEKEVNRYSTELWNNIYKPLVDQANKNIDNNSQQLVRLLKRLSLEQEE